MSTTMQERRPRDVEQLRAWVWDVLGIDVPAGGVCAAHGGPMDYLAHAHFEYPGDVVVWANRGGGKTFYGALATLLDLLFKPGIEVRILGGSLDQSRRMYEYLRWMLNREGLRGHVAGKVTERGVSMTNGSRVELLAQSERSVRGHRVQKLRCDEVDLFDREVWDAAQFVTRSARCGDVHVRGSVEALSTMHRAYGLMSELAGGSHQAIEPSSHQRHAPLDGSVAGGLVAAEGEVTACKQAVPHEEDWRLIKWCALDVLARCPEQYACQGCVLWDECRGGAKSGRGFVDVEDVMSQKRRTSVQRYQSEMLCRRPSRSDAVFREFSRRRHVRPVTPDGGLKWIGGMDFGLRNPFVMLWAQVRELDDGRRRVEVVDEYIRRDRVLVDHVREIEERGWPVPAWVGVDPAGSARSEQTGRSAISVLRERGYRVLLARAGVLEGVEMVERWVSPAVGEGMEGRRETGTQGGQAIEASSHRATPPGGGERLVIDPRCRELIKAMESYHFDPANPRREQPVKDGPDHAVDALRYMLVNLQRAEGRVEVRGY